MNVHLARAVDELCSIHRGSVTSWWRSELHNRAVGGRPHSMHLGGLAMDVVYDGNPPPLHEVAVMVHIHGCRVFREKDHDHIEVAR